jgi:ATP-dependent helicase/nuclease subunit A
MVGDRWIRQRRRRRAVSAAREIPAETRERQRRASDPESSAWVSANAGSGKTHVLAQRVLRLLLAGAAPGRILCLTFTKAAAANMSSRVFKQLAEWTALSDERLAEAIVASGASCPGEAELNFARKLFARAIETPGGLKIQTLHAFCERLLHMFPFEANVAAGFRVVEEREARELLREARAAAFAGARVDPDLAASLDMLARIAGAEGFETLLAATLRRRGEIAAFGDADAYATALRQRLGLQPDETEVAIRALMRDGGGGPRRWRAWADALLTGTKSDKDRATALIGAAATLDPELSLETYLTVFFTQNGPPRKVLATKAVAERFPDIVEQIYSERDRLDALGDRRRAAQAVARTRALVQVAEAVLARYAELKNARGWLDFDDLIARSLALLDNADAAWVLYKLDAGVDHILVDEAQDTSRPQWDILRKLTGDFLDGAGSSDKRRTFFAVGDEKQSIFSFQGAAPTMFDEMRREFARRHREANLPFAPVLLNLSFRSAPIVLEAVDKVFAVPEVWLGVSAGAEPPSVHVAIKSSLPGVVEVWPTIAPEPAPDPEDWRMPLDAPSRRDPAVLLAERIAAVVEGWLAPGSQERVFDAATGRPRPIGAGDILVLVRSRGALFEAMTRALRQAGVPSAGADRLTLADHIAVMDLVAAGRTALGEDDDLSLAAVLKSPLIGLDDEALMELAPGRAATLAGALAASRFHEAQRRVMRWRRRARTLSPFDFYARLLGADGGRRALLARLGHEAADAIDEFMARALAFEREAPPSLVSFLAEIEAADVAIKRDMEAEGDRVRVMTVHAAKGLEAPIVFLPDTCSAPSGRHDPKWLELAPSKLGEPPLFVWASKQDDDSAALAEARAAARAAAAGEHRRLLYVAMTRAAERLILCGFEGLRERPGDCWYNLARLGLDAVAREAPAPWNSARTIARMGEGARASEPFAPAGAVATTTAPEWLWTLPEPETTPISLAPSHYIARGSRAERRAGLEAGRLAHVLLQELPEIGPERRRSAAEAFLESRGGLLGSARRAELVERALDTLALPELAELFGPRSRAEVAVAGILPRPGAHGLAFSGRVDRLAVTADALHFADFKTGWAPGVGLPEDYVAQLALYRTALAPLYPGLEIRASLVWVEQGTVSPVSPRALDLAMERWTRGGDEKPSP